LAGYQIHNNILVGASDRLTKAADVFPFSCAPWGRPRGNSARVRPTAKAPLGAGSDIGSKFGTNSTHSERSITKASPQHNLRAARAIPLVVTFAMVSHSILSNGIIENAG
jgi:hypothetical protein